MVFPFSRVASGVLALVLSLSSLSGILCADGPDEQEAMACCRGEAHDCNMPERSDETEDCCKPDRTSRNPASVERSEDEEASAPTAVVLPSEVALPEPGHGVLPFSCSRGSPSLLANRPLDIPLLN